MKIHLIILVIVFLISCNRNGAEKKSIPHGKSIEINQINITDSLMVKIESELSHEYTTLTELRFNSRDFDSIEKQSKIFTQKIIEYTSQYPQTLFYKFNSLKQNHISIITSNDSLFRIYSWNTWLGGTMDDFSAIVQYKTNNKVITKFYYDSTGMAYIPYYSKIFSLKTHNDVYYLTIENKKYSTRDLSEGIRAFQINNDIVNDSVQLFETSQGLTNELSFEYDFFSVVDYTERPIELIKYDSIKQEIHIPIVNSGEVTKQYKTYKFNGNFFEQ